MIVLDANVLIAQWSESDAHAADAFRILDTAGAARLKLPDAYVLATAVELDAVLATFDRRLALAARERDLTVIGA